MTLPIPSGGEAPTHPTSRDQAALFASLFHADADSDAWSAHLGGVSLLRLDAARPDDTCTFVVVAFHARSGRSWKTDAVQVAQTAAQLALPLYLERLPQAEGVHAWIFFAHPVAVLQARRLASALLYRASAGDLKVLKSFDRVIPLEGDRDPVALPLFGSHRLRGDSVFVAPQRGLPAWPDQWALVASVARLHLSDIDRILTRIGGGSFASAKAGAPGSEVIAVSSASLVVRRPLPPAIAARLRQRLAYPNAEFLRRKREGMSLRKIPRRLLAWQRRGQAWLLPRGLAGELAGWCERDGCPLTSLDVQDRWPATARPVPPGLLAEQRALLERVLPRVMASLTAPDDVTRTTVALATIAERGQPTLLLTANRLRVQHWREQALLAGFEEHEVVTLGETGDRIHPLTVATYGELHGHADRVDGRFGQLVLDDCTRTPIDALLGGVRSVPAAYVLGLSDGTPRPDGLDDLLELLVGPALQASLASEETILDVVLRTTRFQLTAELKQGAVEASLDDLSPEEDETDDELFAMPRPQRARAATAPPSERAREWNALLDALARDDERNRLVVADVVSEARQGAPCLVLTGRREHALDLTDRIARQVGVAMAIGSMPVGRRREALRQFRDGEVAVLVVTEQLIGPGFDPAQVSRLFLALPLKADGQLRQLLSLLMRGKQPEQLVRVYDYIDERVPRLASMAQTRRRYYRKANTTLNIDAMQLRLPFDEI